MAILKPNNLIVVNGIALPAPTRDFEIISTQAVNAGRNANGAIVSQLVGRRMWKLNNIQWHGLDPESWATIQQALEPFFVSVTFFDMQNIRRTVTMYPSDITGKPFQINQYGYEIYETCKFNLIDCGWEN